MVNLFEDNGQYPTLAASILPSVPVTEVKPAAANSGQCHECQGSVT